MINVCANLCVLHVAETTINIRLDLFDAEAEDHSFEDIKRKMKQLTKARQSSYVFKLTLWKQKRSVHIQYEYKVGHVHKFEKIHSLSFFYDTPQGNVQLETTSPTNTSATRHTLHTSDILFPSRCTEQYANQNQHAGENDHTREHQDSCFTNETNELQYSV